MYRFIRFLLSMLKIGCIGFGGGSALIPVIEREFIGEGKLDSKENFDKDILVASLTPGALPVELAASLGWRNFGFIGMILAASAMALPGAAATLLLVTCLSALRSRIGATMEILTILVSVFIIIQIIRYALKVCRQSRQISPQFYRRAVLVMIGVFLLSCGKNLYSLLGINRKPIFSFSTLHILVIAFVAIIVINLYRGLRSSHTEKKAKPNVSGTTNCKDILIWLAVIVVFCIPAFLCSLGTSVADCASFFGRGILSVLMSFGGGDAYLAVADGLFVSTSLISASIFYNDIVAVANILPGSILCKILTAVGYYCGMEITGSTLGGLAFALGGFTCSVAVSSMVFALIYHLYERLSDCRSMKTISHYIGPIISGILGTVALALMILCKSAVLDLLSL